MTSPTTTSGAAADEATPAPLPLSFAQEQLWLVDQLTPGESTYNSPLFYRLRGPLDVVALRRAFTGLVARHDALRTTFGARDGVPYQTIAPPADVPIDVEPLAGDHAAREAALSEALHDEVSTPFDLRRGPLYRIRLLRVADEDHLLCLTLHHIVTDGWSTGLLQRDLGALYRAAVEGHPPRLAPPPGRYAAHVRSQRARATPEALEEGLAYWAEALRDLPTLDLPGDRPRPVVASQRGRAVTREVPAGLVDRLHRLCRERGVSPFMALTAALATVLATHAGQEDLPLGVPLLGRDEPELEDVVGLFVNMVVLRLDLTGDPTFTELLDRVAEANLSLYDHADVPFERVVERVRPVRDESRNPLFGVCVQLLGEGTTGAGPELPGVAVELVSPPSTRAPFDLSVDFTAAGDRLTMHVQYATDLFDDWRIEALLDHLSRVLDAACADPDRPLSALPLLSGEQERALLALGDGGPAPAHDEPLDARIAAVAAGTPDAVAAVCRGRELTYGELLRRADGIAAELVSRGVGPGRVVAVVVDRDLDVLPAMLGVLRAGAAFAVLDPQHPAARLEHLIRDTAAPVVLTRSALLDRLPAARGWEPVLTDLTPQAPPAAPRSAADALAAVVYTSGSTGRPKGVALEHAALACFVAHYRRRFDLGPADRMLQFAALTFDVALGEILTALTVGATLLLVSPEEGSSPDEVAALARDRRATYLGLTPTMLASLEPGPYPDLRAVMSGGEVLPAELVNAWNLPGRRMVNLYGPTEAAVGCADHECAHDQWRSAPPIGRPHPGRRLYVIDRYGRLAPHGANGELLIGGAGLARGYLGQPELTRERFGPDPFRPDGRVYRSGDLVRWNADGRLEFLRRLDDQVKLRGLRVEPGEVEAALVALPGIRRAAVAIRPDARGEPCLVGYLAVDGTPPEPAGLRARLGAQLPAHLVPAVWVVLDELPLTTSQKIDRTALPDPGPADPGFARGTTAPATATERALAAMFEEVLGIAGIGADADLFALGGNSLQAMRLISRINRAFGVKLQLRQVYGAATVADVAALVDPAGHGRAGR
ncbi:amino acid adenylation domain-containing protein [Micromonospora sp. NPDC002296]|uniref:amino acid adenylation domain-containing protein n=1 Tax=Micromonospora sp. NPDC002296 TaxID=3154271 RepID=UPI003326FF8F